MDNKYSDIISKTHIEKREKRKIRIKGKFLAVIIALCILTMGIGAVAASYSIKLKTGQKTTLQYSITMPINNYSSLLYFNIEDMSLGRLSSLSNIVEKTKNIDTVVYSKSTEKGGAFISNDNEYIIQPLICGLSKTIGADEKHYVPIKISVSENII